MKPSHLYPPTMNLTTDIVNDKDHMRSIESIITTSTPYHIVLSHNISDVPFLIQTDYLTLSYNVRHIEELIALRRELTRIQVHTIIIHDNTNLINYLRENTFTEGSGLFGAILHNQYIHKIIIQYDPLKNGSRSVKDEGRKLKKSLKKEQREYRKDVITPLNKIKIRVYYD